MGYTIAKDDYLHGGSQKDFYSEAEVEACPCPLCGQDDFTRIYTERGHLGIVRCNRCTLIYTNPRAKNASENYFGNIDLFYEEARLIFKGKAVHHRDRNYAYELRQIKRLKPSGKLLDIGSNMGFFLRKAREAGFDATGVEPSASLAEIARKEFGLDIINSYFETAGIAPASADVITLIDVLEHVVNPQEVLATARGVLKDDGLLCIKVPNGDYNLLKLKLAQRFRKTGSFDLFNSFEHVIHYTVKTMRAMMDQNGFRIRTWFIPLPIHPPVWEFHVGHYYQYPSPFCMDRKRILARNAFYCAGRLQKTLGMKVTFAPDLMVMVEKKR